MACPRAVANRPPAPCRVPGRTTSGRRPASTPSAIIRPPTSGTGQRGPVSPTVPLVPAGRRTCRPRTGAASSRRSRLLHIGHQGLEVFAPPERVEGVLHTVCIGLAIAHAHRLPQQLDGLVRLGPGPFGWHARALLTSQGRQGGAGAREVERLLG